MYPKLVYQHQTRPGSCIWRDLYCATSVKPSLPNAHSDELMCLLMLNLKTLITKVIEVSFGTPRDYTLQNLQMISVRSWKPQFSNK